MPIQVVCPRQPAQSRRATPPTTTRAAPPSPSRLQIPATRYRKKNSFLLLFVYIISLDVVTLLWPYNFKILKISFSCQVNTEANISLDLRQSLTPFFSLLGRSMIETLKVRLRSMLSSMTASPCSCSRSRSSVSCVQAWSRSYVEMYTIAHEWTIENFVELDEEATVVFKIGIEGNEELKFKLSLKPRYEQLIRILFFRNSILSFS